MSVCSAAGSGVFCFHLSLGDDSHFVIMPGDHKCLGVCSRSPWKPPSSKCWVPVCDSSSLHPGQVQCVFQKSLQEPTAAPLHGSGPEMTPCGTPSSPSVSCGSPRRSSRNSYMHRNPEQGPLLENLPKDALGVVVRDTWIIVQKPPTTQLELTPVKSLPRC